MHAKNKPLKHIIVLGDARDFHAMDWYRSVKSLCPEQQVIFATDLIESENREKIVSKEDIIVTLVEIDRFLIKNQSVVGNLWRNMVKLILTPLQVLALRKLYENHRDAIIHAHTMYYMFLCYLAKVPFVGTPQGNEVLVRPQRSILYKFFTKRSLRAATQVSVDSINMAKKIFELAGKEAVIIQNGIDIKRIVSVIDPNAERPNIVSIRGMCRLYRINALIDARDRSQAQPTLQYVYPFFEDDYALDMKKRARRDDQFIGKLGRDDMYRLLNKAFLVISIPMSDSSPRSVYEAIFSGCCVAVTYNPWIDVLPECMKKRVFVVNLEEKDWLDKAISHAKALTQVPYRPSEDAASRYDQYQSAERLVQTLYFAQ